MREFYRNQTKSTAGVGLVIGNFYRKPLITLFLLLATFFLGSCGGLMEEGVPNGYGRITINTPGSREISADEIAQMTYKFYFNGVDYGSQNTAMFPVGSSLTVKIEGYVGGVLRASKTDSPFIVEAGDNYRSIMLSRSADEVIPPVPAAPKVTITFAAGYYLSYAQAGQQGTWNAMAGVNPPPSGDKDVGAAVSENMSASGYSFMGWILQSDYDSNAQNMDTQLAQKVSTYPATASTLVGIWRENAPDMYTVTYDLNDGTGSVPNDSNAYTQGQNVTVLMTPEPTRTGWDFMGWSQTKETASQDSAPYAKGGNVPIFQMPSANVRLYAVWRQQVAVTVTSTANYPLGNGGANPFYVSKNTDITNQVKAFIPTSATTASNGAKKYTWRNSATVNSGTNATLTVDIDSHLDVETAFDVQVRFNNNPIGNAFYAFNGDDITNQIKNVVDTVGATSPLEKDNKRYAWNDAGLPAIIASSNTTHTYDVDARLKVTAVKITLYAQATESSGNSLIVDFGLTVTTNASADGWYNLNANLPTASLGGSSAAQYVLESGWRTITGTAQTTVTEDMAGQTLYPIVRKVGYTLTVKHYVGSDTSPWNELTNISGSISAPSNMPTALTSLHSIKSSHSGMSVTITITEYDTAVTEQPYTFTTSSLNGAYGASLGNHPDVVGDVDIQNKDVNGDIVLCILWMQ